MTLSAAFDLAEQTGQAQTVDRPEHRLRIRLRISEYGDRQLALVGAGGAGVSEAVAVAVAVEAGFGKWTTDRSGAALMLTETEAADAEPEETAPLLPWEDATPAALPNLVLAPMTPHSPVPRPPKPVPPPLPDHLQQLVQAARAGELPRGARALRSGLVTDLGEYVLAWAAAWPGDRAHILRRLEEGHEAAQGKEI